MDWLGAGLAIALLLVLGFSFSSLRLAFFPPQYPPAMVPASAIKRRQMMKDEMAIEAEIAGKGLNAPRLNPSHIDACIVGEDYHVFPGTTLTVCCLTLRNGFNVTGESAAASPENFDADIGRRIARENARNKIWSLEGYRLKQSLFELREKASSPD